MSNNKLLLSEFINFRYDEIIISPEDKRHYRGLRLNNGLKVLLISDPTTDKSAASMDVNVGSMQDPIEIPGLAHFCEHMLFMGSEKYPVENGYSSFLSTHGGTSNAFTTYDHTNYHFDVAPEHLNGAIDIFAQFFIGPLFTADATEREANAVDSENSIYLKEDYCRFERVEVSLSKPDHDYSKFTAGSLKTLLEDTKKNGLEPREELLKFHKKFYSANIMCLCVLGKETLDELCEMVVPIFSAIENKNVEAPQWLDHPIGPEQVGYRINIVPIKDWRKLCIKFPIPDLLPFYKSKPASYISHLLGHEASGSLLSELKNLCWATSLSCSDSTPAKGFGFIDLRIELTEEGFEHVEDIFVLTFQYIKMLNANGPQEWIHRENEDLKKLNFRFKEKDDPSFYVQELANDLHNYPFEEVIFAPYMMPEFKQNLLIDILNKLSIDNVYFFVTSKIYKGKTDKKEKWYDVEYSTEKFSQTLIDKCCQLSEHGNFRLPEKNDFIPTKFDLYPRDPESKDNPPEIIFDDPISRVWYKQDNEFLLPNCCVFFHIRSPLVYSDPLHFALTTLFVDLLTDELTEYAYNAELAGLSYWFGSGYYGLYLNVTGYNDKQSTLLTKLAEKMASFKQNPKRFDMIKENYIRYLKDFAMNQPVRLAQFYASKILNQRYWSYSEILQATENLTIQQLMDFVPRLFSAIHIEAYVHGNTDRENAIKLIGIVRDAFSRCIKISPLFASQLTRYREIDLGYEHCSFSSVTKVHATSAAKIIYQTGLENTRENMLNQLLVQILEEPCFDQLRTKEQLGYIVANELVQANGTLAIEFTVQTNQKPEFVDARIELFLKQMEITLADQPLEEFETHKVSLATKRLEKPKTLMALAYKYWNEIEEEQYHFNRDEIEVNQLRKLTKEELIHFFKNLLCADSPVRKKLSVYVHSVDSELSTKGDESEFFGKTKRIIDIVSFKSESPLFPLPKPYLFLPRLGVQNEVDY